MEPYGLYKGPYRFYEDPYGFDKDPWSSKQSRHSQMVDNFRKPLLESGKKYFYLSAGKFLFGFAYFVKGGREKCARNRENICNFLQYVLAICL